MGLTTADLVARLTSAYTDEANSNIEKLLAAFVEGYWSTITTNITEMRTQLYIKTATGKVLERFGKMVQLPRRTGESDATYRLRIYGAIRRRFGSCDPNSMMEFVESFIGGQPGDVTIIENDESGVHKSGYFRVTFPLQLLSTIGFPESQFPDVIAEIEKILSDAAGAGITAKVTFTGGAEWDSGQWDSEVYGV